MSSPSISVIICAYTMGRWDQLQAAVQSVLVQSRRPDEVIVVADHCPELERSARATMVGHGVAVIANSHQAGLSGARNTGVEYAMGDVVVFLDDDASAQRDWLAAHAACYEDPAVIGVGGLVVPRWAGREPRWFPPEFGWVVGCSYKGQPATTAPVRNPIGANMSYRRAVVQAAGGFSEALGRVGGGRQGCEETELSIRAARACPGGVILHEPSAVVRHEVPASRMGWSHFVRRCWWEGSSKASVSRLTDPRSATRTERQYVFRTLPAGVWRNLSASVRHREVSRLARAAAICAGLGLTAAGFTSTAITTSSRRSRQPVGETMTLNDDDNDNGWWHFNVHDKVGIRVAKDAPAAPQLRTMLACFASETAVPGDITVTREMEQPPITAQLEDELDYTSSSVEFVQDQVQVVRAGDGFRIHGDGELLTALVPVLDRMMVERGMAMIHAATVAYRGHAIALPAAGGTGKTSTVAKLMKKDGFSFMGDDWAFLGHDKRLLGYEKPMFIKPHHRAIYPHLFQGVRKPMVPKALSRPVGRLTTVVHPFIIRYPRLADLARRWSPEHRMVDAAKALPGVPVTKVAPLLASVYVERYSGDTTRITEVSTRWMVDRMVGNFHIEMANFSQHAVTAMAATSVVPWRQLVDDKDDVLSKAVEGVPCYLLEVPTSFSADRASDEVVAVIGELLPSLLTDPVTRT